MKPSRVIHPLLPSGAWLVAGLLLYLTAPSAQAHILNTESGGFASGFHHPWSGWDHILAMVAVGIWGAQLGPPAIWVLPVAFPLVMSVGGFLALVTQASLAFHLFGVELHMDEIGIAFSLLGLGAMVLCEAKPPVWVAAVLVGVFGLCHGYAHGKELPAGESGLLYSIGFVVATGTLHGVGITIGLIHRWPLGQKALRAAGACILLAGAYFLWDDFRSPAKLEKPAGAKTAQNHSPISKDSSPS